MKLADVLTQNAILTAKAGVTVERFHTSQLVVFKHHGEDFVTLQGDEADKFNDECMTTYNEIFLSGSDLGMDIVELALAEPYLVLLENK